MYLEFARGRADRRRIRRTSERQVICASGAALASDSGSSGHASDEVTVLDRSLPNMFSRTQRSTHVFAAFCPAAMELRRPGRLFRSGDRQLDSVLVDRRLVRWSARVFGRAVARARVAGCGALDRIREPVLRAPGAAAVG